MSRKFRKLGSRHVGRSALACEEYKPKRRIPVVGDQRFAEGVARTLCDHLRQEPLEMLDRLNPAIGELDQAVVKEAENCFEAVLLMRQRGGGPVTALAFVLTLGPVDRFQKTKQVVSYLGLNPREDSSGGRQRLGSISRVENPCTHPGLRG